MPSHTKAKRAKAKKAIKRTTPKARKSVKASRKKK